MVPPEGGPGVVIRFRFTLYYGLVIRLGLLYIYIYIYRIDRGDIPQEGVRGPVVPIGRDAYALGYMLGQTRIQMRGLVEHKAVQVGHS